MTEHEDLAKALALLPWEEFSCELSDEAAWERIVSRIAAALAAARVEGLRMARAIAVDSDTTARPGAPDWQRDEHYRIARERVVNAIDDEIAALERGKTESET